MIIFDIYENNAFAIQQELLEKYPKLNLVVLIGSVRDSRRINQVFEIYKPEITYHAAAHKHVPLMEDSACESIKNNAIGTYKTAYAAMMNGCKRFVLISTDKAVNPTNIMGASKRLSEMIIQSFDEKIKKNEAYKIRPLHAHYEDHSGTMNDMTQLVDKPVTEFVAVRFGNVLGSNGSVIPTFMRQIEQGGPVTVTHPKMTRFFMTIPEAVSLVLQAGCYAQGGEIFVFDMGKPVRIATLARRLIRLYADKDKKIEIKYVGIRPGEKLFEETLMKEEGLKMTANRRIYIGSPLKFDRDVFLDKMQELMMAAYDYHGDNDEENNKAVRSLVKEIVTTYDPQQDNVQAQCEEEAEQKIIKKRKKVKLTKKSVVLC